MKRRWWLAGLAAVVLAVVGAGVVMAQTPTPGSGGGTTFLDRVAQKLGIETPKLQDAIKSAANDEVDQALKDGKITQQQADAIKQRIANGKTPDFGEFPFGKGGRGFGFEKGFGFGLGADTAQLATFLGISQDQLKTELQASGATLATVAQAHGKSRDDLKTFITNTAKTQLDQAVKNGKLSQQQEDAMLSKLNDNLDSLIDHNFAAGFGHGRGRGHGNGMMPMMPNLPSSPNTPAPGTRFGVPGSGGGAATSAIFRG